MNGLHSRLKCAFLLCVCKVCCTFSMSNKRCPADLNIPLWRTVKSHTNDWLNQFYKLSELFQRRSRNLTFASWRSDQRGRPSQAAQTLSSACWVPRHTLAWNKIILKILKKIQNQRPCSKSTLQNCIVQSRYLDWKILCTIKSIWLTMNP